MENKMRRFTQIGLWVTFLFASASLFSLAAAQVGRETPRTGAKPALPCCQITSISAQTGVVTAQVKATGQPFQFEVKDLALLNSLKTGGAVWANFKTGQVSLNGLTACCQIVNVSLGRVPSGEGLVSGGAIHRQMGRDGELQRAWYTKGGVTIQVSQTKRQTPDSLEVELLFTEGGQTFLQWTAEHLRERQFRLNVRGRGVAYSKIVDFRGVSATVDGGRVTLAGRAMVKVKNNSQVWNGEFDFSTMTGVGLENAPGFARVLPQDVTMKIIPLLSEVKSAETTYYQTKARQIHVEPVIASGGDALPMGMPPLGTSGGSSTGGGGGGEPVCSTGYSSCLYDAWAEYLACIHDAKGDPVFFQEGDVLGCMTAFSWEVQWCTYYYCGASHW